MLHREPHNGTSHPLSIKQVEFNTISVAGACHATRTAGLHAHLARSETFHPYDPYDPTISPSSLPENHATSSLVSALSSAHYAYGPPKSPSVSGTAILIIVQPFNYNIADERPLEFALWGLDKSIPTYRCFLQTEILAYTTLTSSRELLYHPPSRVGLSPLEVSVAYFRAGHTAAELVNNGPGIAARLQIERSRAIKCPSIPGQLAGMKVVQMALSLPGTLERFMPDEEARKRINESFGVMYSLDDSDRGRVGKVIAVDSDKVKKYVLKPCREGGGHNVYRAAILAFLRDMPRTKWKAWILMELFDSPSQQGRLMTETGVYEGDVVSELGVIGTVLWGRDGRMVADGGAGGWTFKTKPVGVDEMSVVKGWGCFDCPRLVDGEDGND
jgi:glutathione synthetase